MTAPKGTWNRRFDFRQGGTFAGVTEQLDYFEASRRGGALAFARYEERASGQLGWNYHGYGAQNFIELDARFASDGTLATAEKEFARAGRRGARARHPDRARHRAEPRRQGLRLRSRGGGSSRCSSDLP